MVSFQLDYFCLTDLLKNTLLGAVTCGERDWQSRKVLTGFKGKITDKRYAGQFF